MVGLWDRKKDVRASVCRSATKGWYLRYERGGYRRAPAYYRLSEREAVEIVEKIRMMAK